MKKRIFTLLLGVCMMFAIVPTTTFGDCVFSRPDGTVEVWGTMAETYTVGEAFRSKEVGLNYYKNNSVRYYGDKLEFWANGVPIKDGYKFTEVGQKVITVKRGDWKATYELRVTPILKGKLKECTILKQPAKKSYRQTIDAFDPKDIVVRCVFTDGTTQDLEYKDLEFYAGSRNMANYKAGKAIKAGYRFVEPGEKDLIVRVLNKEMRIPFTVTPFSTKDIAKMEMIKEPTNFTYKVGEAFRAKDYAVRCYYSDGKTEDFNGDALNITANGVQLYEGYKFVSADKKNVVISLGDFSIQYTLTVSK